MLCFATLFINYLKNMLKYLKLGFANFLLLKLFLFKFNSLALYYINFILIRLVKYIKYKSVKKIKQLLFIKK